MSDRNKLTAAEIARLDDMLTRMDACGPDAALVEEALIKAIIARRSSRGEEDA